VVPFHVSPRYAGMEERVIAEVEVARARPGPGGGLPGGVFSFMV